MPTAQQSWSYLLATRIIAVATKQGWDLVLLATNGKWCLYNRQITLLAVNAAAV